MAKITFSQIVVLIFGSLAQVNGAVADNKFTVDEGLDLVKTDLDALGLLSHKVAKVNPETVQKIKDVLDYVAGQMTEPEFTVEELLACAKAGCDKFGLGDNTLLDFTK